MENTIWYAGPPGVLDADPAIQRQIATANTIVLERGVASDTGLTGGTGAFSVYAYFAYIDRVHAEGKGISFQEYALDAAGQQYGLASYFLISDGNDSIGDSSTNPGDWFPGYGVNLGTPLGPRTYNNGIFQRSFTGGMVLLGEPGLASQSVPLGGTFTTLDGTSLNTVTLAGQQGYVLLATTPLTAVLNGASQTGGALSPGEIVSVPGSYTGASAQVLVNGAPAPIIAVASNQVNAIVPFGLNLSQSAQVVVQQGQSVTTATVPVAAASPAIFTLNSAGTGPGAILNQDYSVNSASNGAAAGTVIMVYATGFGTLSPSLSDGEIDQTLATTATPVTATIGGVAANVLYAGAAPGLIAGVVQVNVQVPAGVATNAGAPISLQMGSFTSQPGVTVSIQ
jgi:uncharacterized protein (TIGR03437 family)